MCNQFITNFQCGHQTCFPDACHQATKHNIDPSECEELQTIEEAENGYCPNCFKEMSAEDDDLETLLKSTRPEWEKEFLDDESLDLVSNLKISGGGEEEKEQADMARAIRESIGATYGGQFSLEDFRPDENWRPRPIGHAVAESSATGAAVKARSVSRQFVSIPPLKTEGFPPPPGPPPDRALPPTPTTPTAPQLQSGKGKAPLTQSPVSPSSSPPTYSLFPQQTSPGRPSNAPDLVRGASSSVGQSNSAPRGAGRAQGGRVPPPVESESSQSLPPQWPQNQHSSQKDNDDLYD